ncbi:hypothetical protein BJ165DRAFT_1409403 [Panaeolus papilionaceus]|nr:hypothetical protein BJ165DRAFT_1409403 [Panaeolus papilionaceus]
MAVRRLVVISKESLTPLFIVTAAYVLAKVISSALTILKISWALRTTCKPRRAEPSLCATTLGKICCKGDNHIAYLTVRLIAIRDGDSDGSRRGLGVNLKRVLSVVVKNRAYINTIDYISRRTDVSALPYIAWSHSISIKRDNDGKRTFTVQHCMQVLGSRFHPMSNSPLYIEEEAPDLIDEDSITYPPLEISLIILDINKRDCFLDLVPTHELSESMARCATLDRDRNTRDSKKVLEENAAGGVDGTPAAPPSLSMKLGTQSLQERGSYVLPALRGNETPERLVLVTSVHIYFPRSTVEWQTPSAVLWHLEPLTLRTKVWGACFLGPHAVKRVVTDLMILLSD